MLGFCVFVGLEKKRARNKDSRYRNSDLQLDMGASLHLAGPRHLHQYSYHQALFYTYTNRKPAKHLWRDFVMKRKSAFLIWLLQTQLNTRWCYSFKPMNPWLILFLTALSHPLLRRYVVPTGQGIGGAYKLPENSGSGTHTWRERSSLSLKP